MLRKPPFRKSIRNLFQNRSIFAYMITASVAVVAILIWQTFFFVSKAQISANTIYGKFYQFDIVAETGQNGLLSFDRDVSINDNGTVAFIGRLSGSQGIFVGDGSSPPMDIVPGNLGTGRIFGVGTQINNNNQIITRDAFNNTRRIRVYDGNG